MAWRSASTSDLHTHLHTPAAMYTLHTCAWSTDTKENGWGTLLRTHTDAGKSFLVFP